MANDGFIEFLSPGALTELKEASVLVDNIATQISAISKFKAPKSPSGADNAGKKMTDDLLAQEKAMEKARAGLQKLSDAQKKAESQRKASINAEWKAFEDAKRKEKGEGYIFEASDSKADDLLDKYGEDIFNLNNKAFNDFLIKYVKKPFTSEIKKQLGQ